MANPATPRRPHPRHALEPSPSFSVYFSDDDTTSPQAERSMDPTPLQRKLLGRLQDIAQQILRKDLSNHAHDVLDTELDALEQTLQEPEPQSREPADVEDSGLFMDDDDDDDDEQQQQDEDSLQQLRDNAVEQVAWKRSKHDELEARFKQVVKDLHDRYEEVQHVNKLAVAKLDASTQRLGQVSAENENLRKDLVRADNDVLYLKMQLRGLEAEAHPFLDTSAGSAIREGVERWKAEWKATGKRSQRAAERQDSAIDGLGIDTNGEEVRHCVETNGSPRSNKSRITITRPGVVAKHSSDPFVDKVPPITNGKQNGAQDKNAFNKVKPAAAASSVSAGQEDHGEVVAKSSSAEEVTIKTPWEELWDGLAALTGMQAD